MSNDNYQRFASQHQGLPRAEIRRRWRQHLANSGGQRSQVRRQGGPRSGPQRTQIPECSRTYASALVNPWETPAACIPSAMSQHSQKTKVFMRGTANIGTNRVGWVMARVKPSNDGGAIKYTNNLYPGTMSTPFEGSGTGIVTGNHNSPYNNAAFNNSDGELSWRTVAAGIRVMYTGTELNRSGRVVTFESPDHVNLEVNDDSPDTVRSFDRAVAASVDRKWKGCTYQPIHPHDLAYQFGSTAHKAEDFIMVAFFTGEPGETYEFEVVFHFEFIGSIVRSKTPTPYEPIFQSIINKTSQMATSAIDEAANLVGSRLRSWVNERVLSSARGLALSGASTLLLT